MLRKGAFLQVEATRLRCASAWQARLPHSCYLSGIGSAAVIMRAKRGSPRKGYFLTLEFRTTCSDWLESFL